MEEKDESFGESTNQQSLVLEGRVEPASGGCTLPCSPPNLNYRNSITL